MTRVATLDLGTNSTRLLIADVAPDGTLTEVQRRSTVTRLGQDLERTGVLADEAMDRVRAALASYREAIDAHGAPPAFGVLTSAARDAANGPAFTQEIRDRYGVDARTIPGDEEARLTYLGAISARPAGGADAGPTLVIDVGGGSTELALGRGRELVSHVSTQVGVVRHSERHLHGDPPAPGELDALRADARATLTEHARGAAAHGIAVGGTATSCAGMLAGTDHRSSVHGARVGVANLEELLSRTAALTVAQRRELPGLHPDRAPTIVAGMAILLEAAAAHGLTELEVSERDILHGAALQHSGL
jgi:exopolyphosphatase/guanosine-5'-triphosphate,3'-diphosphate pyrophosphatase